MSKQIDIISTQTSSVKNSENISTALNKEVKTQTSLFDKLLLKSTTPLNIEEQKDKNTLKTGVKEETSDLARNKTPTNQNSSLFDSLILESEKNSSKENIKDGKQSLKLKQDINEIKEDKNIIQSPNIIKAESSNEIEKTKDVIETDIKKEETKPFPTNEIKNIVKTQKVENTEKAMYRNNEIENKDSLETVEEKQNINKKVVQSSKIEESNRSTLSEITSKDMKSIEPIINTQSEKKIIKNEIINIESTNELDSIDEYNKTEKNNSPKTLIETLPLEEKEELKILKINDTINKENNSKSILNNIYLSSQRNNINNNILSNKTEAINLVSNATSMQDVKLSAEKLDLNIKDINIEDVNIEVNRNEIKKDNINLIDRKSALDKIILNKNAVHNENNNLITKSVEASNVILSKDTGNIEDVSLNVNASLANSIQTKIIAARQQVSSMMSDVARKMYENYKPPVTAFRINLNPGTLGHIAITMKSEKDNSINISLNISNSATLDSFIDNQNSLKNALNKTFDDNNEFNLDFSSSDQSNEKSNNQKDSYNPFSNESNTQTILESREKNLESEDRNLDYM